MASPKGRRRRRAARAAKIAAEAAQAAEPKQVKITEVPAKKVVKPAPVTPTKKEADVKSSVAATVSSKARKLKEKLTSKS